MRRNWTRRQWLKAAGVGAGSLAFLPVLDSQAEVTGLPKRIVFFFTPNGLERTQYTPSGGETDFTLKQILSPLEAYRKQLLIVDGCDLSVFFNAQGTAAVPNDHSPPDAMCLTGAMTNGSDASGPSIDQFIAQRLKGQTTFESLAFSVGAGGRKAFWKAAGDRVVPMADPKQALTTIFAGVQGQDPQALRLRAERQGVLSMYRERIQALQGKFTSTGDKEKLEAHLAGLQEIENSLTLPQGCQTPSLGGAYPSQEYERSGQQHMDLIAAALACDLSRVVTLEWRSLNESFAWLGVNAPHHKLSHFDVAGLSKEQMQQKLWRIGEWYAEQFAYLLGKLAAIKEGDGTLLDNTVVVWCNEQNLPSGSGTHSRLNLPYVLAGGAGGGLKPGRYLNFQTETKGQYGVKTGIPNNRLFLSLCHALGLSDVSSFGKASLCADGPISELHG